MNSKLKYWLFLIIMPAFLTGCPGGDGGGGDGNNNNNNGEPFSLSLEISDLAGIPINEIERGDKLLVTFVLTDINLDDGISNANQPVTLFVTQGGFPSSSARFTDTGSATISGVTDSNGRFQAELCAEDIADIVISGSSGDQTFDDIVTEDLEIVAPPAPGGVSVDAFLSEFESPTESTIFILATDNGAPCAGCTASITPSVSGAVLDQNPTLDANGRARVDVTEPNGGSIAFNISVDNGNGDIASTIVATSAAENFVIDFSGPISPVLRTNDSDTISPFIIIDQYGNPIEEIELSFPNSDAVFTGNGNSDITLNGTDGIYGSEFYQITGSGEVETLYTFESDGEQISGRPFVISANIISASPFNELVTNGNNVEVSIFTGIAGDEVTVTTEQGDSAVVILDAFGSGSVSLPTRNATTALTITAVNSVGQIATLLVKVAPTGPGVDSVRIQSQSESDYIYESDTYSFSAVAGEQDNGTGSNEYIRSGSPVSCVGANGSISGCNVERDGIVTGTLTPAAIGTAEVNVTSDVISTIQSISVNADGDSHPGDPLSAGRSGNQVIISYDPTSLPKPPESYTVNFFVDTNQVVQFVKKDSAGNNRAVCSGNPNLSSSDLFVTPSISLPLETLDDDGDGLGVVTLLEPLSLTDSDSDGIPDSLEGTLNTITVQLEDEATGPVNNARTNLNFDGGFAPLTDPNNCNIELL